MRLSAQVVPELQNEIRRSAELRYAHRLHGLLLVAKGMTFAAAAEVLCESPRALKYWARRYHDKGLAGLRDETRSGRPPRLTEAQLGEIANLLQKPPRHSGLIGRQWSGGMLAGWIERHYGVRLGVRQCERVLRTIRMP